MIRLSRVYKFDNLSIFSLIKEETYKIWQGIEAYNVENKDDDGENDDNEKVKYNKYYWRQMVL